MELPADLHHPRCDHHRCRIVSSLVQDGTNDDNAKPAGSGNAHHLREDRFDLGKVFLESGTERRVFPLAMPNAVAVLCMYIVVNRVPVWRRCHGEYNRPGPDLFHPFRRLQNEAVVVADNLRARCGQHRLRSCCRI